jgi:hypothetical protein
MQSPRRSRLEWSQHVRAWQESGLSGADYASRHGLNPETFVRWCRRLCPVPSKPGTLRLVAVTVATPCDRVGPPIEIVLPSGVIVRAPTDGDFGRITLLVRALVAPC